jgi:hypothetical protein
MIGKAHGPLRGPSSHRRLFAALCAGASLAASGALADQPHAEAAVSRADGRIEMAARQAGVAPGQSDETFALARQKLEAAKGALASGREDRAEMLADEASLLADLTVEKAKLAALMTSRDLVATAAGLSPQAQ